MDASECKFFLGQVVHHRLFDYRGVIFDVDPVFSGSEDWYRQMARSRPPRHRPWYHVLVSGAEHSTYVAERNLEVDPSGKPVEHPALEQLFSDFSSGQYNPRVNNK